MHSTFVCGDSNLLKLKCQIDGFPETADSRARKAIRYGMHAAPPHPPCSTVFMPSQDVGGGHEITIHAAANLVMETRVIATDAESRAKFKRYYGIF